MRLLSKLIDRQEMIYYVLIGIVATAIDWLIFTYAVNHLNLYYQLALVLAYSCASVFHYIANKVVTFKCHSRKLGSQLSLYVVMSTISLLMSMAILTLLIKVFFMQKVLARIMTTGIMILPNYLLHKNVTFSKKIFTPRAV